MILAFDVGNSTIVAGMYDGGKRIATFSASSTVQRTPEETWRLIDSFMKENGLTTSDITGAGISSVVPFLTSLLFDLVVHKTGHRPLVVSGSLDVGMPIHYDDPAQLGSDRICAAVAGYHQFGGPLILVDFGTATTYGVISQKGEFLGGAIALGVKLTADTLHSRTAQLPRIDLALPARSINTNTSAAVQAGTVYGAIDSVEGMIQRITAELEEPARVIATGGLCTIIGPMIPAIEHCNQFLVLDGVRLLVERSRT